MKNVKVVKDFFNKTSAKKEIAFQNRSAKQNGLEIIKIEVVDSLHLYYTDSYFKMKIKKIGRPEAGKLIIVIYYKESNSITAPVVKQPTPTKAPKAITKVIEMPLKKTTISLISPLALISKTNLIDLCNKNNTHIIRKVSKCISFHPYYYNRLAS